MRNALAMTLVCLWLTAAAFSLAGCSDETLGQTAQRAPATPTAAETPPPAARSWVGSDACGSCHQAALEHWRGSHHDLAMQPASADTVLGDFSGSRFDYAGFTTTFNVRDGRYLVTTDGADGALQEFVVAYTFGVAPLQQYLIAFEDGRLQALSIVWDTRDAAAGGQRWFHLYPAGADQPAIDHSSPLHWTGPLQNWNYMCSECHSTRVARNYDARSDRFDTRWEALNVGCEACHGPGSSHVDWAAVPSTGRSTASTAIVSLKSEPATWVMNSATGIAARQPPRQSSQELDSCARCHSRRSQLTENYQHGGSILDSHLPAMLEQGLYFADGQIEDEVYVYGSFLQSAMHAAGVSCSDCHDAHSLQLRATGNALCAQCHLPARFDTATHHHHAEQSAGADCVNCHMPARTYMQIDGRRDHSFRLPRPDLTLTLGVPDACSDCHDDRDAGWAARQLASWRSGDAPEHYGQTLAAGRNGQAGAADQLLAVADNPTQPAIVRATALELLAANPHRKATGVISLAARSSEPLLRLAAARTAPAILAGQSAPLLIGLLADPLRAVRQQAALSLLDAGATTLGSPQQSAALDSVLADYRQSLGLNADRTESWVSLGNLEARLGDYRNAAAAYRQARSMAPPMASAWVNAADLLRRLGREDDAGQMLTSGLDKLPESAALHHALGLSLVRRGQAAEALARLRRAAELAPENARFAYVLGIALNSSGRATEALDVLQAAHTRRTGDRDLLLALSTIARDAGDTAMARGYAQRLLELDPDNNAARSLLRQLTR